jgi:hypothetical protein
MLTEIPIDQPINERRGFAHGAYWTWRKKEVGRWSVNRAILPRKISTAGWVEAEPSLTVKRWLSYDWGAIEGKYFVRSRSAKSENAKLKEAIAESRSLLALQPDWDGEGSPGYSESTWKRMERFLRDHSRYLNEIYGTDAPVPEILPGSKGSLDILWKCNDCELLVNIPVDLASPASFYGDDKNELSIKGQLHPTRFNQGLLQWLVKHQSQ